MFKSTNTIESDELQNKHSIEFTGFFILSAPQYCKRSSLLACALESRVPHSESFGHLVDVEHMVSRRLLTNVRGDMVCEVVTSLIVPNPF